MRRAAAAAPPPMASAAQRHRAPAKPALEVMAKGKGMKRLQMSAEVLLELKADASVALDGSGIYGDAPAPIR